MNQDKLLKFTGFMTSVLENMAVLMYGVIVQKYLTTYPLLRWLMSKHFVFMVVFLQVLRRLIRYKQLIANKKYLMRDQ